MLSIYMLRQRVGACLQALSTAAPLCRELVSFSAPCRDSKIQREKGSLSSFLHTATTVTYRPFLNGQLLGRSIWHFSRDVAGEIQPDCEPGQGCRPAPKKDGRSQDYCCKDIMGASVALQHTQMSFFIMFVFLTCRSPPKILKESKRRD